MANPSILRRTGTVLVLGLPPPPLLSHEGDGGVLSIS